MDLKGLSTGTLSWVALVAAALATGVVAGCGGGSSPGSGSGPVPGENTQLTVVASSTANDQLVHFGVALNGLSLTNKAGTTVPVLSTPQEVEFIHLNGSAEPLATVSVPQDVYTSATVTVGSALFTCIAQNPSNGSDTTADYAYGYTLSSQVTTQLPGPLTVDGDTMAVSLEMLVSQSASFPSTCYPPASGIAQFSITPTFNLMPMTVPAQPTNPMNGKLTALEGLVVNPGAGSGSFTVAAADGSPWGSTLSTIWNMNTNSSTAYQGIGSAGALTAGMAVDLDGTLQADGSVLATRVAVPDTDTTNLVVNQGPLIEIWSSVPILQQANQETEEAQEFIGGWGTYNFSNATFATWGGIINVASLPFAASFDAANMVPGQMVAITSHVTSVVQYPTYVPATVVTLMPQTIDGTVEAVGTANAFTTYTIALAPYDVFPQFAVQGGQTTLLTNPLQVVVYADQNTQMLNAPAVGSAQRFTGVIFNDNGTLRMDCTQVAGGVAE
jgi:hypothetical protein